MARLLNLYSPRDGKRIICYAATADLIRNSIQNFHYYNVMTCLYEIASID
jgi:hypothetical protein